MSVVHVPLPWHLCRTWLYVPGHRPDRVEKALTSGADAVVIDLEDSVPPEQKASARRTAVTAVSDSADEPGAPRIWVRVNDPATEWFDDDVAALSTTTLAGSAGNGVRVPKAEDPDAIGRLAASSGLQVHLLIESAAGLMRAPELAGCHPRVTGVALGEADLAADLRVHRSGLDWARGWIVTAARAAGLTSPIHSVYTDVADLDGLRADTHQAQSQGFFGRSVIHPTQIATVNAVFTPSSDDVRRARAVVDAAERAAAEGSAALLDSAGRFIDNAVVHQARVVLAQVRPPQNIKPHPHFEESS